LKAAHCRDTQTRDEIRILSEGLLDAAPARLTRDIDHRAQRLMGAACARFGGRHRVQPLDEIRIERGAEADRLREARALRRRVTVQTFLMEDDRNPEPRVADEKRLDVVRQLGHLPRGAPAAGVARAADLAEALAAREMCAGLGEIEAPLGIDE